MRTKTLDDTTQASDPGRIRLSGDKLRRFHPELFGWRARLNPRSAFWRIRIPEHLQCGDSRAAVVMSLKPLLIAAYTDELDCVVVLRFPNELAAAYSLQIGTRMLTVNTYGKGTALAADLRPGPASYARYTNFHPLIAEFLSDDLARIREREEQIGEEEWERARALGEEWLALHSGRFRDGRPCRAYMPAR